jgi:hypothetical protein
LGDQRHYQAWKTVATVALISALVAILCARVVEGVDHRTTDVTWEWAFVHAANQGLDLSTSIETLALQAGAVFDDGEATVPDEDLVFRTPGALLVLAPLLLIAWQDAFLWITIIGGICLILLFAVVIPRSVDRRIDELMMPTIAAILSVPVVESLNWGTSSGITGLLFGLAWCNLHSPASGASLGVATTLKLYPGLGVVGLLAHRRVGSHGWAIGVFVALNLLGSLAFDWSLFDAVALIVASSHDYVGLFGNLSLAGLIAQANGPSFLAVLILLVAIAVIFVFSQRHSARQSVAFAMSLALVASPLSWFHYEVTTLPIAFWLYSRRSVWRWAALIAWTSILGSTFLFAAAIAFEALWIVHLIVLVRLLIPVALAVSPFDLWTDRSPVRLSPPTSHFAP